MALTTGSIPGLYNGVSQQAVAMRLPTQGELQENFDATLAAGLKKRPPFEHIATLPAMGSGPAFMHVINRDEAERYILVIRDGQLSVFGFDGAPRTVNAPGGLGYLSGGSYAALTVADYTFIVNRSRTVQRSQSLFPTRPHEALVNVIQGNYSRSYGININGAVAALLQTPGGGLAGSANCASTENIAQLLMDGTLANGSGSFHTGGKPNGNEGQVIWGESEDNYQIVDNAGWVHKHMKARGFYQNTATSGAGGNITYPQVKGADWIMNITSSHAKEYTDALYVEYRNYGGTLSKTQWYAAQFPLGPKDKRNVFAGGSSAGQWTVTRYTSSIYIKNADSDFSISVSDGYNGNAMKVCKGTVQRFSDLPSFAPVGYNVEITGSDGSTTDSYWVGAVKDAGNDANSQIVWEETCKPGSCKGLDPATMPHLLVREADGTFTFKPATWNERECGDDADVNPDPSFVGRSIRDVFFHHNRLGFLSDENVVLSRSGDFFNFFRTTATAYLDDDPIDVAASHVKVSILRHVVPTQDQLVIFSDGTQFRLAGNEMLTPKSVSMRPVTEFSSSPDVAPIAVGKSVFFVADSPGNRDYAAVYDFFYDANSETGDADNITAHVPSYIPAGVTQIIGSPDEGCLAVLTSGDPSALYIHRFYWTGNQKVQSAWMRWTTAGSILRAVFIKSDIYVLVQRPDGMCLEKLRMSTSALDADHGYLIHLDRRVTTDVLPASTYDGVKDTTTFTLPYLAEDNITVIRNGRLGEVVSNGGNSVTVKGNFQNARVYFGYRYLSRYRFSRIFARSQSGDGGQAAQINGRLQLHHLAVSYDRTGYFRVEVDVMGHPVRYTECHGRVLGDDLHVFGTVKPETRRTSVPIMSRNDRVDIDLVNDSWLPSSFVSAAWRGQWNPNSLER